MLLARFFNDFERPSAKTPISRSMPRDWVVEVGFRKITFQRSRIGPNLECCPDSYGMDPTPIADSCEANITAYTTYGTQLKSYGLNPMSCTQ